MHPPTLKSGTGGSGGLHSPSDIWKVEELLWTGGTDAFERRLGPICTMAFPGAGILDRDDILPTLSLAPRWSHVDMRKRHQAETNGTIVLAYHAHALREGDAPYDALCSSTWVDTADGWRIVQHQQSPLN